MKLIEGTGKKAALARIAKELSRLETDAAAIGEEMLAYLIRTAWTEADSRGEGEPPPTGGAWGSP